MATLFDRNSGPAHARRLQVLAEAQGYYAATQERCSTNGATILVSGTVYYVSIGLLAGDVVSNVHSMCTVLGSTFTGNGVKFGLYNSSVSLLASTLDVNATFASTGAKVNPFVLQSNGVPFVVPSDGGYYLAMLAIATTPPTMVRGIAPTAGGAAFAGASVAMAAHQAGQTDLPTSGALTSNSSTLSVWMGVS